MTVKRRKPLGRPLPPVETIDAPNDEQLNRWNAEFYALVPEWAGILDPKAPGTTPAPKFYRDEITGIVTRARDGMVVTDKVKRAVMDLYTRRVRGLK